MYLTYRHKDDIIQIVVNANLKLSGFRLRVKKPIGETKGTIELLSFLGDKVCASLLHTYKLITIQGKNMPQLFGITVDGNLWFHPEYEVIDSRYKLDRRYL